jgi:tRNA pseudouridine38-40 synthase
MRIAAGIEYDGSDFLGWQRLSHGASVQAAVESALSFVADHPVEVTCAGRTDTAVHARCQVIHFDSDSARTPRAWQLGANSRLPHSVCLRWVQPVADDFHARYLATARRYRYTILNRAVRPALGRQMLTWERVPLDAPRMHAAAQALVGEHDFSAFRTVACQARSPNRRVDRVAVTREGEQVVVEIQANAFLHHMVRNIVGSLLPVGRGEQPPGWIAQLLAGRDRALAGPTAPPNGLVFVGPLYPPRFGLPAEVSAEAEQAPADALAVEDEA